jgi:hypothetical protein
MSDRVQEAASQIEMEPGEKISLQFEKDESHRHSGDSGDEHSDAFEVEKKSDEGYKVTKMRTDEKKK